MNELLVRIGKQLEQVNTTVTCPACGNSQSFNLEKLNIIRLGTESMYTGTGGAPMVVCEHCRSMGRSTLLHMSKNFYNEIQAIVFNAILDQPPQYIADISYENTQFYVAK